MNNPNAMSAQEFRQHFGPLLESLGDDDVVYFGSGDLRFYRTKERGPVEGPRQVQIEFNQAYAVTASPRD